MAKYAHDVVVPDKNSDLQKKEQVANMFNSIAGRYDLLNHFLSAGIDVGWRKKAINELKNIHPKKILDVATGTADLALLAEKKLKPELIVGIDIADAMLKIGCEKITKSGLSDKIILESGDSETIKYADNSFDAVTVAFGVRNFQNLEKGLTEMQRVLKPGGKAVILEFSKPKATGFKSFYKLYMKTIAPGFAGIISKNKDAYTYLGESVHAFPEREDFISIMQKAGFSNTYFKPLSAGICCIYCGSK